MTPLPPDDFERLKAYISFYVNREDEQGYVNTQAHKALEILQSLPAAPQDGDRQAAIHDLTAIIAGSDNVPHDCHVFMKKHGDTVYAALAQSPPPVPDGAALKAIERVRRGLNNECPMSAISDRDILKVVQEAEKGLPESELSKKCKALESALEEKTHEYYEAIEANRQMRIAMDHQEAHHEVHHAKEAEAAALTTAPVQSVTVEELLKLLPPSFAKLDALQFLAEKYPHGLRILPQPPKEGE